MAKKTAPDNRYISLLWQRKLVGRNVAPSGRFDDIIDINVDICRCLPFKIQGHVLRMREQPIESWKVPAEFFNFVQSATSRWRELVVAVTEGKGKIQVENGYFVIQKTEAKKKWERCRKRIYLETNIFKSWLQAKCIAGYEVCTDSAFAVLLLSLEFRRR